MFADCLTNSLGPFEWFAPPQPPPPISPGSAHTLLNPTLFASLVLWQLKKWRMAIIMERRLLLYTACGAEGGSLPAAPSLSGKLMIRYHKTQDGHVKMEWPPAEFSSAAVYLCSAFILILHPLALILLYTCKNTSNTRSFCRFLSWRICSHVLNE